MKLSEATSFKIKEQIESLECTESVKKIFRAHMNDLFFLPNSSWLAFERALSPTNIVQKLKQDRKVWSEIEQVFKLRSEVPVELKRTSLRSLEEYFLQLRTSLSNKTRGEEREKLQIYLTYLSIETKRAAYLQQRMIIRTAWENVRLLSHKHHVNYKEDLTGNLEVKLNIFLKD